MAPHDESDMPPSGTTETVAEAIRHGIRTGQFAPGQHLVEVDLTRRLGISRSSLREALRQLSGDGVVTMSRYRGAYIGTLSRKAVDDLLEVLEQLVALAAARATRQTVSPEQRTQLRNAVDKAARNRASSGQADYIALRQGFYDALFEIAGNRELPRVMPLRRADLFRAQIRSFQTAEQQDAHVTGYQFIAEAVLSGDGEAARDAVLRHFAATRAMLADLPEAAFGQD